MRSSSEIDRLIVEIERSSTPLVGGGLVLGYPRPPSLWLAEDWAPEAAAWAIAALAWSKGRSEEEVEEAGCLLTRMLWTESEAERVRMILGRWAVVAPECSPGIYHSADLDGALMATDALLWVMGGA